MDIRSHGPSQPGRRLRVLAQCKAEKTKAGPKLIREMEGVARRGFDLLHWSSPQLHQDAYRASDMPKEWQEHSSTSHNTLPSITTIVCTRTGFSSSATVEALRSRIPMLLLHIPFEVEDAIRVINWQQESQASTADTTVPYPVPAVLRAAYSNPALTATNGVLGDSLELRKEFVGDRTSGDLGEAFSVGLWWR
jgi:hypothetical protein